MNAAVKHQWSRRESFVVDLTLPFPPSMNDLWRHNGKRVYRTPRYMSWINVAGQELELQKPGCIRGNYVIVIQLERKDKRRRDAGNFEKAVSDLLQAHGVIEEDSLADSVTTMWAPSVKGCRVVLTAVNREVPFG